MDEFLKMAFEMVKAQAGVRAMTADEMTNMALELSKKLAGLSCAAPAVQAEVAAPAVDPKKSVKEKSVTCLECGKAFKILSKKHLASHGLDKKTYCEKFGLKKGTSLCAKGLVRARKIKMTEMKLWERRGKGKAAEAKLAAPKKAAAKKAAAPKKAPKAAPAEKKA